MNLFELLFVALVGWTLLGVLGTLILLLRRERVKGLRGLGWVVRVWLVYLAVLVGVSLWQPRRTVSIGQDQCFDEMCFAVTGVDEMPRFLGRNGTGDGSRLLRVTVRVKNNGLGRAQSESLIHAYLVDGQGRHWEESRGVNGNRLTGRVSANSEMISEPVFKIASNATGIGLVFTHGGWQPGVLVIGDSDSWLHRRTVVWLGR